MPLMFSGTGAQGCASTLLVMLHDRPNSSKAAGVWVAELSILLYSIEPALIVERRTLLHG